jgi:hypothetical protein
LAEKRTYTCDVCGAERKETNHWFYAIRVGCSLVVQPMNHALSPFSPTDVINHLCGETCALKKVGEFISAPHLLPPPEGVRPS